jgi:rhodanese-related sulfurtransferase
MKKIILSVIVLSVIFIVIKTLSTSKNTGESISALDFVSLRKSDKSIILLDVRQPEEFKESSIDGSLLIPLGTLKTKLSELDKDAHYVVHCRSGSRSARAQSILKAEGFDFVLNLEGGILAWQKVNNDH